MSSFSFFVILLLILFFKNVQTKGKVKKSVAERNARMQSGLHQDTARCYIIKRETENNCLKDRTMNFEAEVHRRLAKEGIIDNLPRYERLATPYRDDDPFIIKLREEIALAEKERLER